MLDPFIILVILLSSRKQKKTFINLFRSLVVFLVELFLCYWIAFLFKNVMGLAKVWEKRHLQKTAQFSKLSSRICLFAKIVHNETVRNFCQHPMFYRVVTPSGMHQVITDPGSLNLLLRHAFPYQMPHICSSPTFCCTLPCLLHTNL